MIDPEVLVKTFNRADPSCCAGNPPETCFVVRSSGRRMAPHRCVYIYIHIVYIHIYIIYIYIYIYTYIHVEILYLICYLISLVSTYSSYSPLDAYHCHWFYYWLLLLSISFIIITMVLLLLLSFLLLSLHTYSSWRTVWHVVSLSIDNIFTRANQHGGIQRRDWHVFGGVCR